MSKKIHKVNIRVSAELKGRIIDAANAQGRTISTFVERAIKNELNKDK